MNSEQSNPIPFPKKIYGASNIAVIIKIWEVNNGLCMGTCIPLEPYILYNNSCTWILGLQEKRKHYRSLHSHSLCPFRYFTPCTASGLSKFRGFTARCEEPWIPCCDICTVQGGFRPLIANRLS